MLWITIQSIINGIFTGGVYSMVAVGVTIIFGVMRMVNFASGPFLMVGMYMTWLAYKFIPLEVYYLIPIVFIMTAAFSYIAYRLSIKPIINGSRTSLIISTVGLSFLLQNLAALVFGTVPYVINTPVASKSISIGGYAISVPRAAAFLIALILTLVVSVLINKTTLGRCMKATSESAEITQMLGIKTDRIYAIAWMLGIGLTGVAGLLVVPLYPIAPNTGGVFRSTGLIAVVMGGMGDIRGAFISGILLGIVESLCTVYIDPSFGPAGMFILFLLVLYFKPFGLFGKGERVS